MYMYKWKELSVRTSKHVRHSTNIPGGDINVEGISVVKHCTTPSTKKSNEIHVHVWVVKRGERNILVKIKIKKKDPDKRPNVVM